MSLTRSAVISLVSCLMLFNINPLVAEEAAPTLFQVSQFNVKLGYEVQFEEFLQAWKKASKSVKEAPTYYASSPGIGAFGLYSFATPIKSFTELAVEVNPLAQVYDEAEAARLFGLYRESTISANNFVVRMIPALSNPAPPRDKPYDASLFYNIDVNPGMEAEYTEALAKIVEASKKVAKDNYFTTWVSPLGGTNDYTVIIPRDWVDLDTPPKPIPQLLTEAFGKKVAARTMDTIAKTSNGVQITVRRNRPDLSYIAGQ